jgi:ubiquinone/menaquinone biosynthesis C-methylase UbiE
MKNYKEDSRRKFDGMASDYEKSSYGYFSRILYEEVVPKAGLFPHDSILDLGCGKGILLEKLKTYGSKLYGADISAEMIRYAQERVGEDAELKVTDSENLPWDDNSIDVIVCTLSFHHYPNPAKTLNEIKRVLKNNGYFIVGELMMPALFGIPYNYFLKSRFNKSGDVRFYSKSEWVKMLGTAGFDNIVIERKRRYSVIITAGINK